MEQQSPTASAAPAAVEPSSDRPRRSWTSIVSSAQGPLVGLVLLCAVFAVLSPYFLSIRNGLNVIDQVTVLGIMAIGMTAVIVIGGIDLSVGSILALSMMVMGWLANDKNLPFGVAVVLAVLVGGACGLGNGLLVTRAKLPPFIATLAMMTITRGLANIITNGEQIVGYPDWFTALSTQRYFGFLSATVALFILLLIASYVILQYRAVGRNLYAIGGSREVARLAGIHVDGLTTWVYVVAGALSGIAGVVFAARLDSSQPSAGLGYELDAIAAVVIGGASLSGGVGGIGGTLVGVLIIGVLHNGLNLVGVSPFIQQIIVGAVIAIAVAFDSLRRRDRA
jgi:ribose transport system permease protein